MSERTRTVYIGAGNWEGETGKIQVFSLDLDLASLTLLQEIDAGGVAAYMTRSPDGRVLYVADEAKAVLSSYTIDSSDGRLTLQSRVPSEGHPVYVALDGSGRALATCFFGEARTQIFAIEADGSLGASAGVWDSGRESHSVVFDPSHRFLFVPTRGDNWIAQYRFDPATRQLSPNQPARVTAGPGAGPRHLTFHPNGRFAYLVNELTVALSAYSFDPAQGTLTSLGPEVSAALPGVSPGSAAHLQTHPEGKFIYVSNRQGDQSNLAIFSSDAATGRVALLGHEATRGRTPRHFSLDPEARILIAGNQDSNDVAVFRVTRAGAALEFVRSYPVAPGPFFVGIY
jgi:6-phosphogluconolactonase